MKVSPPAVVMAPPRFGTPAAEGAPGVAPPRGTRHAIVPERRSTPTSAPNGGGVHGTSVGRSSSSRYMA